MSSRFERYRAAVATVGFVLLVALSFTIDVNDWAADWPLIVTLSAFFIVGQFFSIPLSREPGAGRVMVNAPFAFALVLYADLGVAAWAQVVAFVVQGIPQRRRLPIDRTVLGIADHTIGLSAGGGVWIALSGGEPPSTSTLPAILAGAAVFVAVKALLFAFRVSLDDSFPADVTASRVLRQAVGVTVMILAGVLVIVLAADELPVLLLALLLPTVAVYLILRSEVQATIERTKAEQTARREAELRNQEHELLLQQQDLARRLQETDRMKDDLLAMVSHELRNPLSTVLGVMRLLRAGAPLSPEEHQEMLEMGDRQARRLRGLIEQLLLAARFEQQEETGYPATGIELVETDATELVLQAATEAQAGQVDHPIRVECDGSLPVRVAPDAIVQILANLLDNARKYSPEGRLVRLLAGREGGDAVLAVEDDGAGVPPGDRDRVFERFTRLSKDGSGLGLGLYIARQLARAQGGDLVLTTARHAGGARFELRLPLRERATAPTTTPRARQAAPATDR